MSIDARTRNELIKLASSRKTRTNSWTTSHPTHWDPGSVRNPKGILDTHFTDASAWELIVTQLQAGCEVDTIELEKPRGKKAYVINVHLDGNEPKLYVKVQLGSGIIIGRSFHYSKHPK